MSEPELSPQKFDNPLVFFCSHCNMIISDSYNLTSTTETSLVLQKITDSVIISNELILAEQEEEIGSVFALLYCKCSQLLGRFYQSTPQHLDPLRQKFVINADQLGHYELDSCSLQAAECTVSSVLNSLNQVMIGMISQAQKTENSEKKIEELNKNIEKLSEGFEKNSLSYSDYFKEINQKIQEMQDHLFDVVQLVKNHQHQINALQNSSNLKENSVENPSKQSQVGNIAIGVNILTPHSIKRKTTTLNGSGSHQKTPTVSQSSNEDNNVAHSVVHELIPKRRKIDESNQVAK